MAKLYSTPITQTLPTTNDGLVYIYLGRAYSTYQIELSYKHPIYYYASSKLMRYTGIQKTSEIYNDSSYVSDSSYVHTDNNFTNLLKSKLENIPSTRNCITIMKTANQDLSNSFSKVTFNTYESIGDKLTFNSTNSSIVVGAGVSMICLSGMGWFSSMNGYKWVRIRRLRAGSYTDLYQAMSPANNLEGWATVNISPVYLSVQEGDEFTMWALLQGSSQKCEAGTYGKSAYISAEVVS